MATESEVCDALDTAPNKKYRFFNQPIEQIPGYLADKPQMLVHSANCGLQWHTIQCMEVVTCLKLETESSEPVLKIERRKVALIKDIEEDTSTDCPDIPLTKCDDGSGQALSNSDTYIYSTETKRWEARN